MILVTGATGRVGYRLLEALADAKADATAMVRVEAKGLDLPGPGENLVGTFDDPPARTSCRPSTGSSCSARPARRRPSWKSSSSTRSWRRGTGRTW